MKLNLLGAKPSHVTNANQYAVREFGMTHFQAKPGGSSVEDLMYFFS